MEYIRLPLDRVLSDLIHAITQQQKHDPAAASLACHGNRTSVGCLVRTTRGPRARACILSTTMCFSFW